MEDIDSESEFDGPRSYGFEVSDGSNVAFAFALSILLSKNNVSINLQP